MVCFRAVAVMALLSLLSAMVTAVPEIVDHRPEEDCLKPGQMQFPVAQACNPNVMHLPMLNELCEAFSSLAVAANEIDSFLFCSHGKCGAKYDPSTGSCRCVKNVGKHGSEITVSPEKNCKRITTCFAPFEAYWNPFTESCTCSVEAFPKHRSALMVFMPKLAKQFSSQRGCERARILTARLPEHTRMLETFISETELYYQKVMERWERLTQGRRTKISEGLEMPIPKSGMSQGPSLLLRRDVETSPRQTVSKDVSPASVPTYIPPSDIKVTPGLLQESLHVQPQQLATVGSVIPYFGDGVISFLVQLDGPISQTLTLNASDTLPCDAIGATPPPGLVLVPQTVDSDSREVGSATCFVIAVHMYDPHYITYRIQKEDGTIVSLLSDNQIHTIDRLDTSRPGSVTIRVVDSDYNNSDKQQNAASVTTGPTMPLHRRQIFSVACNSSCPFYHMNVIKTTDGHCGCVFKGANQNVVSIRGRGVEESSQYTATMTAEACAAMTCLKNRERPAQFNRFTATCWCIATTNAGFDQAEENEAMFVGGSGPADET